MANAEVLFAIFCCPTAGTSRALRLTNPRKLDSERPQQHAHGASLTTFVTAVASIAHNATPVAVLDEIAAAVLRDAVGVSSRRGQRYYQVSTQHDFRDPCDVLEWMRAVAEVATGVHHEHASLETALLFPLLFLGSTLGELHTGILTALMGTSFVHRNYDLANLSSAAQRRSRAETKLRDRRAQRRDRPHSAYGATVSSRFSAWDRPQKRRCVAEDDSEKTSADVLALADAAAVNIASGNIRAGARMALQVLNGHPDANISPSQRSVKTTRAAAGRTALVAAARCSDAMLEPISRTDFIKAVFGYSVRSWNNRINALLDAELRRLDSIVGGDGTPWDGGNNAFEKLQELIMPGVTKVAGACKTLRGTPSIFVLAPGSPCNAGERGIVAVDLKANGEDLESFPVNASATYVRRFTLQEYGVMRGIDYLTSDESGTSSPAAFHSRRVGPSLPWKQGQAGPSPPSERGNTAFASLPPRAQKSYLHAYFEALTPTFFVGWPSIQHLYGAACGPGSSLILKLGTRQAASLLLIAQQTYDAGEQHGKVLGLQRKQCAPREDADDDYGGAYGNMQFTGLHTAGGVRTVGTSSPVLIFFPGPPSSAQNLC